MLTIAARCNNARIVPGPDGTDNFLVSDAPTEGDVIVAARKFGINGDAETLLYELPFDSTRKAMSVAVRHRDGRVVLLTKGAAEVVLRNSVSEQADGASRPLRDERRREWQRLNSEMAQRALRVLAFAYRDDPPDAAHGKLESELVFAGLVGMIDPPRDDRTDIVYETMDTLREALTEEAIVGAVIVIFFLLHLRSLLTTLPLSVAMSFIVMYWLGVDSNIMSLAGIAIAIGDVADMGIIITENIYRRVAANRDRPYAELVRDAACEVGPAIGTAVSNTIVSFIPVFTLTDQEGKLFRPLASYTKTFAISASVILAIKVVPVLAYYLLRPTQWSRLRSLLFALPSGVAATLVTHFVIHWQMRTGSTGVGCAHVDCRRRDGRRGSVPNGTRRIVAARGECRRPRSTPGIVRHCDGYLTTNWPF